MSEVCSWSPEQEKIFYEFEHGTDNVVVIAFAGTGKTTTAVEGANRMPEQKIQYCAFNKSTEKELSLRLKNPRAQAKTLHSIGLGCIRQFRTGVKILEKSERADWLTGMVTNGQTPDVIKRLISKLHTKGREITPYARSYTDLVDLAYKFECEPDPDQWDQTLYSLEYVVNRSLEAMELASKDITRGIDFSDMIFLPVRNRWMAKTQDAVIGDEVQDWTLAQLEIMKGICRGRMILIGDPNQAIYGFRGADCDSIARLKGELNAKEFPLTVTYRCGKVIVDLAKQFVPSFQAAETNPDGQITMISGEKLVNEAQLGDFILSRVNAPLVSTAMGLLRSGKRARISGRDIGKGLQTLVRKLVKGAAANSVPVFLERVSIWEQREIHRYEAAKKPEKVEFVKDQALMLVELSDGAKSVSEIGERIKTLFTDDGLGQAGVITCSSVHRAKGLEADRVFILRDTLKRYNQEELNIIYVAITRAKKHLIWVGEEKRDA